MQNGGLSTKPNNVIISLKEMRLAQRLNGINFPGLKWLSGFVLAHIRSFFYRCLNDINRH
jgi:hypothetical protein